MGITTPMAKLTNPQSTAHEPTAIILSVWIGLVFWIGLFWIGGILASLLDVRLGIVSFAPAWLQGIGLLLGLLGLLLIFLSAHDLISHGHGSPNPLIAPPRQLVTRGLYAYLRHPMYLGFIAVAFGYGFLLDSILFTVVFAPLVLMTLAARAYVEEQALLRLHGNQYHAYRKSTPAFYPRLRRNKL